MHVLVIDDERTISRSVAVALEAEGHHLAAVQTGAGALQQLQKTAFELALLDLRLGQENGLDVLDQLRRADPRLSIVVITAYASVETAVDAMRRGASDYLPKPFTPAQLRFIVDRVARTRALESRVADLEAQLENSAGGLSGVELQSDEPAMRRLLELAFRAAASNASLLLLGENGTGKSVLARTLHGRSPRKGHPFVTVSCPSLSRELLESDLFGHVKGAFTGAVADTQGKVAAAAGGTLYLDEIGDLPLEIQPKLLRLLQEGEYERVGETQTRRSDVRIISSTNRDLAAAVRGGSFREDLLYRLNTITLTLPPLRERPQDIPRLANAHLQVFARQLGRPVEGFSDTARSALLSYSWPGNLRELRNTIERAVILGIGPHVEETDLPDNVRGAAVRLPSVGKVSLQVGSRATLAEIEDEHIRRVLAQTSRFDEAAEILGIDPATLYRKRRRLDANAL